MGKFVEAVLNRWAIKTIQNMKKILEVNRKVNTGRLYNSITYNVDSDDLNGVQTFSINYINYGKYVDSGRRAGSKPPPKLPIEQWLLTNHGRSFFNKVRKDNPKITLVGARIMLQKSIAKKGIRPVRFLNSESKIKNVSNIFGSFKTDMVKALIEDKKNIKII